MKEIQDEWLDEEELRRRFSSIKEKVSKISNSTENLNNKFVINNDTLDGIYKS